MDRDLVVTVLFDFEYEANDGHQVHMHKGEEFLVIQQTNSDWWQVIRSGERKPFYAPTQYLKLQPRPRPQLPPKVKQVKRNARDSRRAPLSVTDAERHIIGVDDVSDTTEDAGAGRRRCNSLEDAAAGSSSVETLDDTPPDPSAEGEPADTVVGGGEVSAEVTPARGPAPRPPPARHRRPRISKDLWARRKSWSVDERSRTWELVRPEAAPAPAVSTSSLDSRHRTSEAWSERQQRVAASVAAAPTVSVAAADAASSQQEAGDADPRRRRPVERPERPRPEPAPRPTVDRAGRRPVPPSASAKPAPPPPPPLTAGDAVASDVGADVRAGARVDASARAGSPTQPSGRRDSCDAASSAARSPVGTADRKVPRPAAEDGVVDTAPRRAVGDAPAPGRAAGDDSGGTAPRRVAPEHGRFKQEVLKLIGRSRREDRRTSESGGERGRPVIESRDRIGPGPQSGAKKEACPPRPPPAAQKRLVTLEPEPVAGTGPAAAPDVAECGEQRTMAKSASPVPAQPAAASEQSADTEVAAERAESGPRPDVLPSPDGAESRPGFHRQTSYDRSLQSFSTFSNLRSARIDLAGHNASFKRTAERLSRPVEPPRRPAAGRQVEPPRVSGPPRPPVPPKQLQLRPRPAADGQTSAPATPDDATWSDSEAADSESGGGSWERLDQMRAALCFANPLLPRSGLSRSADHLPVPRPRTRLTEQPREPPPVPHILEAPQRNLHDGWGEYLHHGRKYYYNVDTKNSTWKPPRKNIKSPAVSPDKVSEQRPAEAVTPVLEVDVPLVPLPPGWRRRVDSTGELCYVRDSSPTRWYSNQNEDDHVYFFKEGSSSSTWTLPPAENGASQNAKDAESVPLRPAPVGGVPSVLQVARGQRGRSLVFPPAPPSEPPSRHLESGNQTHVIRNQGTLNHTKLAKETSWRARKNWAPCRVVLTDRALFLFKDTKATAGLPRQWGTAGHRPDTTVDLAGAFVDWDSELSSRKNVFQIRTVRGLRLLLQDDNALTAGHWFDAIKRAIAELPSSTNPPLALPRHVTADDRLTRSRSVRFTEAATGDSQEDISRDNSTIRDRLRRFFRARPPADSLVSRGILKDEPVFGGHLAALCLIEGSTVPRFVAECVAAIEAKPEHMKMDGVYRASGNLSQVQRIRCEVDQDNYQVLWDEEDVHVLTGALKLFFRELKEPLVPFVVLPEALRAAGLSARADQIAAFRRLVTDLPPPNRDTLRVLLCHLSRVTELQEFNRMHAHNLAIVFGPTLMWPEQDSPDLALDLMKQNRVVEALLENLAEVFDSE